MAMAWSTVSSPEPTRRMSFCRSSSGSWMSLARVSPQPVRAGSLFSLFSLLREFAGELIPPSYPSIRYVMVSLIL